MNRLPDIQGIQERLIVDTSEGRQVYLLAVGTNPTYIRLSSTSYYLLEQRSLGVSFESVAEDLNKKGQQVSPAQVEAAYHKVLGKINEIERNPKSKQSEFFFRFPLLPKSWVRPIAASLSFAFSKIIVYFLLGFMALAAWRLKRWQRVIVDIGGVFFQLVVAAVYVIIYKFTDLLAFKLALLMIVGSCLFTLNPVFKFDGYWFLADALGVTNLAAQPLRISNYFFNKFRKRPVKPLPWPPIILIILTLYTFLSFAIWGYFLWFIFPLFWQESVKYPNENF